MSCDFFLFVKLHYCFLFSKRCITDKWMVRASFPIKERHVILDKNDLIWKRNIVDELKAKVIKSAICEKCLRLRQETGPEGSDPTDFFRYVNRFKPGGGTNNPHHIPNCPPPRIFRPSYGPAGPGSFLEVVNNVSMTAQPAQYKINGRFFFQFPFFSWKIYTSLTYSTTWHWGLHFSYFVSKPLKRALTFVGWFL